MAQTGYTPIQIYYSTTTTNAPSAGNLLSGELAINITDGKMFYKDNGGSVQVIAWKTTPTTAGGTGLTSWTAGDLPYYSTGTTLTKLGIGTNGQVLTSTGTAPQWSTLSGVAVTTFSAGTTGFTPSTATSGAVTLAGTLATTNGGTGLTSFTANRVFYASSTSAIAQSANLTFDGTTLTAAGFSGPLNGTVGATTPNTGSFTTLTTSSTVTINGGTANGVAFLDGSKVLTTGSALTWNGSNLFSTGSITLDTNLGIFFSGLGATTAGVYGRASGTEIAFNANNSEAMRLTSTGLGIGTSSPVYKLTVDVTGASATSLFKTNQATSDLYLQASGTTFSYSVGIGASANALRFMSGSLGTTMLLDSSGNLGLGVTPSAWRSTTRALQVGTGTSLQNFDNTGVVATSLGSNLYFNSSDQAIYLQSYAASSYALVGGEHRWNIAPSGTAGTIATFTQAMTLDASGNLGVGETSPAQRLHIKGTGATRLLINSTDNSADRGIYFASSTASDILGYISQEYSTGLMTISAGTGAYSASMAFRTGGSERARITNVGNFSLGTHADRGTTVGTNALQIFNGTAPAGTLTNGVSLYSSSGDLFFMDAAGNASRVGYRGVPQSGSAKTTSYTLATTDVGDYIQVGSGGSITIPDATFATGDVVSIFNNTTGNITITCSITTAYIAGTDSDKATMTLATRGVATVLFISSTVCVVTGNVT